MKGADRRDHGVPTDGDELLRHRSDWERNPPHCSTTHQVFLEASAKEKVERKGAVGPFTASRTPHQRFNSSLSFAVEQPTPEDPSRCRACYDARGSRENLRTRLNEKIEMRGLEGLLDLVAFMMISFPGMALHISAGVYQHAFEQIATHPGD